MSTISFLLNDPQGDGIMDHGGVCPFCATDVPEKANTCSGCGAMWGVSTGRGGIISITDFRKQGQKNIKEIYKYLVVMVVIAIIAAFGYSLDNDVAQSLPQFLYTIILISMFTPVFLVPISILAVSRLFAIKSQLKQAKEEWQM